MNGVFRALADPARRRMLELLREGGMTAGDITLISKWASLQ